MVYGVMYTQCMMKPLTKTQVEVIRAMKAGAPLRTNITPCHNTPFEAWLGYNRVSMATVRALENAKVIKATEKDWRHARYVLA
jgi:hypothetical protein